MKKIFITILLAALMPFAAGAQDARQRTAETIVADALAQLPAQTPKAFDSLMQELAATGADESDVERHEGPVLAERQHILDSALIVPVRAQGDHDDDTPQTFGGVINARLSGLGADTIVSCGGQILGKPKDERDACRMLKLLSGGTHQVYTGVSIVLLDASGKAGQVTFHEKTDVTMRAMSEEEIRRYVATGEPMDKAGAYGIQGKCAIFVDKIDGDYNNVVGLPVAAIYRELKKLGIDIYLW